MRRETDRRQNESGELKRGDGELWFQGALGIFSHTQPILCQTVTPALLQPLAMRTCCCTLSVFSSLFHSSFHCKFNKHRFHQRATAKPERINITITDSALHIKQISIPSFVYSHPFNLFRRMTFTSPPSAITSLHSTQPANSTYAPSTSHSTTILPHTLSLSLLSQSAYRHSIEQSMCGSIVPRATIQGDLALMPALGFQRSEGKINQLETCTSWRQDWVASSFH